MANFIVATIVFGTLGAIVYRMWSKSKQNNGSCHSGCGSCPYACDKRKFD